MPFPPTDKFLEETAKVGVALDEGDLDRFGAYLERLYEANKSFNLTAVRDPEEGWIRHILDSLTLIPLIADAGAGKPTVADVGSGGGAPGLVLAIAMPDARFTLIEATGKKARFLDDTARALGLSNVKVEHARAEDLGHVKAFRERFDVVLARAVGRVAVSAELTVPLAKVGGLILMNKGQRLEEELREAHEALRTLHARVAGVVETPTGRILALEKEQTTARKFPRRAGEPKRAPLGVDAAPADSSAPTPDEIGEPDVGLH